MNKFKVLLFTTLLALHCLNQSNAQQVKPLIEVKCYVELIGGTHTIHHAMISPSRLKSIKNTLLGKEIMITTDVNKRKVHKVIECTTADQKFKNKHAVALQNRLIY